MNSIQINVYFIQVHWYHIIIIIIMCKCYNYSKDYRRSETLQITFLGQLQCRDL